MPELSKGYFFSTVFTFHNLLQFQFFHPDDFQLQILRLGHCPVCKKLPNSGNNDDFGEYEEIETKIT